jgi:hypothetical protein
MGGHLLADEILPRRRRPEGADRGGSGGDRKKERTGEAGSMVAAARTHDGVY